MQTSSPDGFVNRVCQHVYFFGHFWNAASFIQQLLCTC